MSTDRDDGFRNLADHLLTYLSTHREDDLEHIELLMASSMIGFQPSTALLVWDYVNRHPEQYDMRKECVR